MFISKALRRAEVFLEQVDESVAQASRRLVVEGATGAVDEEEELSGDESVQKSRASAIPRAEHRAASSFVDQPSLHADLDESVHEAWGGDVVIDESMLQSADKSEPNSDDRAAAGSLDHLSQQDGDLSEDFREESNTADGVLTSSLPPPVTAPPAEPSAAEESPVDEKSKKQRRFVAPLTKETPQLQHSSSQTAQLATEKQLHDAEVLPKEHGQYVQALRDECLELRKELEAVETELETARREKSKRVKNLKRMKDIVSEMDETLQEKSAEVRKLDTELVAARDQINTLQAKSREVDARGKDGIDNLRKELSSEINTLQEQLFVAEQEGDSLKEENERLKEALLQGHEVELATADGARQEASQAHRAYEAETLAHRETRKRAKEREETLEAEAALAAQALASAERKADECMAAASTARSQHRTAETKLQNASSARDAAFARIDDLQNSLRMFQKNEGDEAPGQKEAKEMSQTVSELENALEAKNVELNRLEGEVEALRAVVQSRRDIASPRTPGQGGRSEKGISQEVEVKLRHMADAALRKQSQLEVLRSENRALQHQLTTERKRTREAQAMAAAASSSRQSIRGGFRGILETGEEERGERLYGVRDGPLARFRTPRSWPRLASKLVVGLDRLSAQALAFLRREPLLRIVILVYLAAMHLFVYSLLHWHVDAVSGADTMYHRVASASKGDRGLEIKA